MAQKRGLGKGLDSLITQKVPVQKTDDVTQKNGGGETADGAVLYVPVNEIEPNRSQPRKNFDAEALQELADSIAQHGVLQPILVCRKDGCYEIVAGERRWRAAKLAKLKTIPVLVREVTDRERREIALIENLQREDLNPIEEAQAYQQLIEEYHLKQDEVAQRVSKSRSAVTNSMRLLKLDERVQKMLTEQKISAGHARALLSVPNKNRQYEIAVQITEKNLSVRDTERMVQKRKADSGDKRSKKKPADPQREAVYRKIEERLREYLGTKVEILDEDGKGKIEISYYSSEELERILEILQ